MKKNNFLEWSRHYEDILRPKYEKFVQFFLSHSEEPPSYNDFLSYCYLNTKKNLNQLSGKIIAPIY